MRVQQPARQRRKVQRAIPRRVVHAHQPHAATLRQDAEASIQAFAAREREITDFDPKLMLRFELNRRVPDDEWRRAGLTVLDSSDSHAAVVFAANVELDRFKRRLTDYARGPRERPPDRPALEGQDDELAAAYESFFDAINEFRPLEPADRISPRLHANLDAAPDDQHAFEVELWFHSDPGVREDWIAEALERTRQLDGEWLDHYVGERAAVLLARVRGNRTVAHGIAELDQISLIDAIPQPRLEPAEFSDLQDVARLPEEIRSPPDDAPVVGIVDTGLRAGHPLLRPAVVDTVALHGEFDGQAEDGHGHGTAVAGVTLYGDVLTAARRGHFEPDFWIASVRVLDDDGYPPARANWIRLIADAIRYLAEDMGCRVINLSFGDPASPYRGGKSTPLAAELDTLARRYRVVLVVAAGNILPEDLVPAAETLASWPGYLNDRGYELIDPAQSAISLTVGAIAGSEGVSDPVAPSGLGRAAVAAAGGPAPYTRHGPGVNRAIKPDLAADGGNWVYDQGTGGLLRDPGLEIVSTAGAYPERLFETRAGTSLAAPYVAHLAGRLAAAHPALSANTLRALVVQAAVEPVGLSDQLAGFEPNDREDIAHALCGYGIPTWGRASTSSPNRVVLYAEDDLRPDDFHVYRIPMTPCFTDVSGPRSLTVALAFDPPVRYRRFDYLAFQMEYLVVRGVALGDVFEMAADEIEDPEAGKLGAYQVDLRPTRTVRSRGTCQLGFKLWSQRPREEFHDDWYIVVRSLNKWLPADSAPQPYSLTVTIDVERGNELYVELENELQIELEAQIGATA